MKLPCIFLDLATRLLALGVADAADRPNLLWITGEDNSAYRGCYGDAHFGEQEVPNYLLNQP